MSISKNELLDLIKVTINTEHTVEDISHNINSALEWINSKDINKDEIKEKINKIIRESRGHIEILNYIIPKVEEFKKNV